MAYFTETCQQITAWINQQKTTPWIFLYGDLGAGKTTLTTELLGHLGFDSKDAQSPTFLKVIAYKNLQNETILHMDAYRIEESAEFLRLGLEDYENIKLGIVEWPEKLETFLDSYPAFKETLDLKSVLRIQISNDHSAKIFQK